MSCTIHAPSESLFAQCSARLNNGQLVAFPTETVYGLGANACDDHAVARIYEAKRRPSFNPLIVHLANAAHATRYIYATDLFNALSRAFWPGPCTLIAQRRKDCPLSLLVSAGLDSVALRVPAHSVAQQLLVASGLPLAAPSANRSGRISPTLAQHVASEFADSNIPVIDGGACAMGVESTVIDARGEIPVILRPGNITHEDIAQVWNTPASFATDAPAEHRSPGMLLSHYAPDRPVRLDATHAEKGEAFLTFGADYKGDINLSENGNLTEAAANLFAALRLLDNSRYASIAVAPIPHTGLGIAINDRLKRAAAPRAE
ncbi:MAG: threonylcarbamoyl-AMP synthase [Alphaproteobacteria bacterium]|nr:threonylcarbamoyl-AMP synthase [Alphaproteobacteria bacterium]